MKGQLEDAVRAMDFDHCIILRPGLLLGPRNEFRGPEYATQVLFRGFKAVALPVDRLCIEAEEYVLSCFDVEGPADEYSVGACIAQLALHPPAEKSVIIGNNEMIALAKQWKEANAKA